MRKLLPSLLLAMMVPASPVFAADAEVTLREGIGKAIAVAERSQGGLALADQLQPILEKYISFEAMTRRAIGPGWRQIAAAQQQEAVKLFTKLIIRSYSNKFTPGAKTLVDYRKASSPGAGKVEIPTIMTYRDTRYNVVYRMEDRGGRWVITDILAEGVSLVANYRAQFDELFKKGGADAILDSLRRSVSQGK